MAEQYGEKTEPATPRKRQEAREQGQVARSTDLSAAVVLLLAVVMVALLGPRVVEAMRTVMTEALSLQVIGDLDPGSTGVLLLRTFQLCVMAAGPMIVGVLLAAMLANVIQVGFYATPKRLQPRLDSLSPLKGVKRIFGGMQAIVQLGMNLLKLTVVAAVAYTAIHGRLGEIVAIQRLDYMQMLSLGTDLIYSVAIRVAVVLLVLAILDYAWKRFKHERDLRMTKQEVREELKRMEGDPMIKARRRQIQMQMSRDRQKRAVPSADVVVTNPTEYAVALKYDPESGLAPRVVAKGRGLVAAEIRRIAIEHGVPILQRPPLARALYRTVEVGQEIPEEFYAAVAEILAYVYELTGRLRNGRMTAGV
ncbi:MAG: flagellar biosynthesis protein FlhB [Tepidisphaerales bacterium]